MGARMLQCDTSSNLSCRRVPTLRCSHLFMLREATSAQIPCVTLSFSTNSVHDRRGLDSGEMVYKMIYLVQKSPLQAPAYATRIHATTNLINFPIRDMWTNGTYMTNGLSLPNSSFPTH